MSHDNVLPPEPGTMEGSPDFKASIQRGHEFHDIPIKGIIIFAVCLAITGVVVQAAMYGVMQGLALFDMKREKPASPLAAVSLASLRDTRPYPLQPSEGHETVDWQDTVQMRLEEAKVLNGSAMMPGGRKTIPIEVAMEVVATAGAPGVSPTTQPAK